MWAWLQAFTVSSRDDAVSTLPVLKKPAAEQQQLEQQQLQPLAEKEFCLRMAFKLTPKYSNKLQVQLHNGCRCYGRSAAVGLIAQLACT